MARGQLVRNCGVALAGGAALSLLASPALGQSGGDSQLSPQERALLQQGAAPVSAQSLPWVANPTPAPAPSQPRAKPRPLVATPATAAAPKNAAPQTPSQAFTAQFPGTPPPAAAQHATFAPVEEPVQQWTVGDAEALWQVIARIDAEGLYPADYQPEALQRAIAIGAGPALDEQASRSFDWLAEDLRDGRTPMTARSDWFILDTDQDQQPTAALMAQALATHDVAGVLAGLAPVYPDYATLKDALAATPPGDEARRDSIRLNMDRWRWLPRDLGFHYLIANVPEFELRLMVNGHKIRDYRTIVGKPGRTATPQLSAKVQSIVFYPTWTVPQSIIEHEGLAKKIAANPAWAAKQGFKVTTGGDGSISIVQQPGPMNSLGEMKIDMPNPHAIYLHDTDARYLFARPVRAFSHGCVRTQNAVELGMTIAIITNSLSQDKAGFLHQEHKNIRVPLASSFPAYITYFTFGTGLDGQLTQFTDLYGRDAPVLASFAAPRQLHTTQRTSDEEVIVAADPL